MLVCMSISLSYLSRRFDDPAGVRCASGGHSPQGGASAGASQPWRRRAFARGVGLVGGGGSGRLGGRGSTAGLGRLRWTILCCPAARVKRSFAGPAAALVRLTLSFCTG
ncbi:hypothetical protein SEVIR_8G167450v4 [Setaria viridis]|uniref:Uncharacterized protein n=1 Tax=Setaria viridis TaxID=4556 RepID=A0A4U6TKZ7_SETVI|nr:hypothetical protein SEVIR_8G167450v2 [Setaria viridis]